MSVLDQALAAQMAGMSVPPPGFGGGATPDYGQSPYGMPAPHPQALPQSRPQTPPPPPAPQQPAWQNPYDPVVAGLLAKAEAPPPPMFTPEQIAQRQQLNKPQGDYGLLGALSGNEALQGVGGTLLKQSLAAQQPKFTDHGVFDQSTGQFTYSPDYLQEREQQRLTTAQQLQAGAAQQHMQQQTLLAEREQQAREHNETLMAMKSMQMGMAGGGAAGGMQSLVDAVGNYQMDPQMAMSRMPFGARQQFTTELLKQYPTYDATTYKAKAQGANTFGAGSHGDMLRASSTAAQHLDQLGGLIDAMGNGNVPMVNQLANQWAAQTGDPAPGNFDAAKSVVSKEVMKAIVAGGGGEGERNAFDASMANVKSPQQLKGVVTTYRGLMGAQRDNLLAQRHALGLPDSTMPTYPQGGGAGAAPGGNASDPLGMR